ncbi:hypothetical protein HPP92_011390 [Vanilla planifolia]|uniref:Uncharacterized protein n=2 Tax=Mesangiospermae TaxID=1437183 RepID=A0A072TCG8_MEDTR|nr:hypothetical protein HPP92_011675 [Vanilla planifolia]KAG0483306.1 hypothetical protein HPP92_011390 [Vanilla planifolia]KEH15122.1 hypothetical protein MTR_2155s0010 [Medicago truncatula]
MNKKKARQLGGEPGTKNYHPRAISPKTTKRVNFISSAACHASAPNMAKARNNIRLEYNRENLPVNLPSSSHLRKTDPYQPKHKINTRTLYIDFEDLAVSMIKEEIPSRCPLKLTTLTRSI